jgi:membrane protein DedA with SNARE-associated domain
MRLTLTLVITLLLAPLAGLVGAQTRYAAGDVFLEPFQVLALRRDGADRSATWKQPVAQGVPHNLPTQKQQG